MNRSGKKRFREQQQFWLDLKKPEQATLSQTIAQLKADREFSSTVRQGIALVVALGQGDLSLLDEMFPQAVDEIFQAGVDSVEAEANGNDIAETNVLDWGEKLTALTTMVEGLSSAPVAHSRLKPMMVNGNLKGLAGSSKPLPGPEDDDDLAHLLDVKDTSTKDTGVATRNFLNSLTGLQNMKSGKPAKPSKMAKKERQSLEDLLEVRTVRST